MPTFKEYERNGRTLMVKFTCQRCGFIQIERLEDMDKDPESYGYLSSLKKPEGWVELLHGPLLCPGCAGDYEKFMRYGRET